MAIRHAHTLDDEQLEKLLTELSVGVPRPLVERAAFLLSYKAGLRVQEIAGLRWQPNVLDPEGSVRHETFLVNGTKGRPKKEKHPVIFVGSDIGKYGSERTLRMHPMVYDAVMRLHALALPGPWLIPSGKRGASQALKCRAHALKMRINRFYDRVGFEGCSSHSGRRTFITKAARMANYAHCSLVDVQNMAGHRQLATTQQYIDTTSDQADLIALL